MTTTYHGAKEKERKNKLRPPWKVNLKTAKIEGEKKLKTPPNPGSMKN